MDLESNPLEEQLARVLRTRSQVPGAVDPLPAVHAGMRRRRRQRAQGAAAGLAALTVVGVALGATVLSGGVPHRSAPAPRPAQQPTDGPVTGPPVTVTDVDLQGSRGYALGNEVCPGGGCAALLVTSDGGATWSRRTARGLASCAGALCPEHVRFANERVGYAYGHGMWITTDSGRTWAQASTSQVVALEISGDVAVRVQTTEPDCGPACGFVVQTSAVGSLVWKTTYAQPIGSWVSASLAVRDARVTATFHGHTSGGSSDARSALLRSRDAGQTWSVDTDPCSPAPFDPNAESDTLDLALGPNGTAVALCVGRQAGSPAGVRVSADSGSTYGGLAALDGRPESIAAPGAQVYVAQVRRPDALVLSRTTDGGATWTDVAHQAAPAPDTSGIVAPTPVRFSSATNGTWLSSDGRSVHVTTDGGSTWSTYPF